MKNIAHFMSGLALASFVPGVMEDAAHGSLLIALGGLCAMLPDTVDFKFVRYFERADAHIVPDSVNPDAQVLADAIAEQMWQSMNSAHSRIIHLHPARRSSSEWILYSVRFDTRNGDVIVSVDDDDSPGVAHIGPIDYTYDGDLHIESLGSTSLRFSHVESKVRVEFLPWHRVWTHSLVIAVILGVALGLVFEPRAGIVASLGYGIHVIEDQLGYMGSALFAPLRLKRSSGAGLLHSGDTIPNVLTVWLAMSLLLLNMDRIQQTPSIAIGPYLGIAVVLPSVLLITVYGRRQWRQHLIRVEEERQRDLVAEAQEYRG